MTCPDCQGTLLRGTVGYTLTLGRASVRTGQLPALICVAGCGYVRLMVEAVSLGDCAA